MGITINTGMVSRQYNTNISLDLRGYTNLDSARIRWKGKDTVQWNSQSAENHYGILTQSSIRVNVPAVPSGWTFGNLDMNMTVTNMEDTDTSGVHPIIYTPAGTQVSGGTETLDKLVFEPFSIGQMTHSYESNNSADQNGEAEYFVTSSPTGKNINIDAYVVLNYYRYLQTRNPQTTINSQVTKLTDTLDDNEVSGWQTLTGLVAGQLNTVNFFMLDSSFVYAEIEYVVSMKPTVATQAATGVSYTTATMKGLMSNAGGSAVTCGFEYGLTAAYGTNVNKGTPTLNVPFTHDLTGLPYGTTYHYRAWATNTDGTSYGEDATFTTLYPYLGAPVRTSPTTESKITDRKPYLEFTLPANANNSATKYHARVRIDEYVDMQNAVVIESKDSQTNWELWNGTSWVSFPAIGVDPGSKVRVKPIDNLKLTTLYWDVASWDGNRYGTVTTVWNFRILLTAKGLYVLIINDTEYSVYDLSVIETANGQIGEIRFQTNNPDGDTNALFDYGDIVQLAVSDVYGNSEEYKGVIRTKTPKNFALSISAVTGSGILSERRIKVDYTSQDIGLTVKAIIDNYCDPLTSIGVNTSTGIVAPIIAKDKSPLNVLEDMRRQYGVMYFIDKDWDTHLYLPTAIVSAYTTIVNGGE